MKFYYPLNSSATVHKERYDGNHDSETYHHGLCLLPVRDESPRDKHAREITPRVLAW